MVVRIRDVAALAAVASALPFSAHATDLSLPTIGCGVDGEVNAINWGDSFSLGAPQVSVQSALLAPNLVPAVQTFACSNNMYSVPIEGSTFSVNFGTPGPAPAGVQFDKWTVATTEYKEFKMDVPYNVTEFDIYANFLNLDGALAQKDFVGIKYWSTLGDALSSSNQLLVDPTTGALVLDPPIGGGSGTLELITTPGSQVPEPSSLVLFGTGLLAAAQALRRKSRA